MIERYIASSCRGGPVDREWFVALTVDDLATNASSDHQRAAQVQRPKHRPPRRPDALAVAALVIALLLLLFLVVLPAL